MADAALGVEHFGALKTTLARLHQAGTVDASALRLQLEKSKPAFKALLQERPQDVAERKELEDGVFSAP
jgi:hypothetical protein